MAEKLEEEPKWRYNQLTDKEEGKTCSTCRVAKPLEAFYRDRNTPTGRAYDCKECRSAKQKTNPNVTDYKLRNRYGITKADRDALGSACEICGSQSRVGVDHNHETGVIRGLLCRDCNLGLGKLGDSAERIAKALEYMLKSRHDNSERP